MLAGGRRGPQALAGPALWAQPPERPQAAGIPRSGPGAAPARSGPAGLSPGGSADPQPAHVPRPAPARRRPLRARPPTHAQRLPAAPLLAPEGESRVGPATSALPAAQTAAEPHTGHGRCRPAGLSRPALPPCCSPAGADHAARLTR